MRPGSFDFGIVGLGVMGRNLALNMGERGHTVVGYDLDAAHVKALDDEAKNMRVRGAYRVDEFVKALRRPRALMLLVPAGPPVDSFIREAVPLLEPGDAVIDGGNSHYRDTELRAGALVERGIRYLGVGISGGSEGARHGPSIMAGGDPDAYERVRALFESAAARVGTETCAAYLGRGSAGHYVKMVHNGIEYGLMELLAESYDVMGRGFGMSDDELHGVFDRWNEGRLSSFLVEITARIFLARDDKTGTRLIDVILDEAKQKGTGRWTSQEAMDLQVPTPTIDAAVMMRNLSAAEADRRAIASAMGGVRLPMREAKGDYVPRLEQALAVSMVLVFDQGTNLLRKGSEAHGYGLNLEMVIRIWRGGCIIRAALLEDILEAFRARPDLPSLMADPRLGREVTSAADDLRAVVCGAASAGLPVPGFSSSLSYLDAFRSPHLPANLVQAQRDYFGSHSYERIDERGTFHTRWEES